MTSRQIITDDRSNGADRFGAQASARYNHSVKEQTVAEVDRRRLRNPRDRTIYREVARQFGVGEQSLRLWVKKKDAERLYESVDPNPAETFGKGPTPAEMTTELQLLRRQIQKLQAENEVLKRAFVVFSSEWAADK